MRFQRTHSELSPNRIRSRFWDLVGDLDRLRRLSKTNHDIEASLHQAINLFQEALECLAGLENQDEEARKCLVTVFKALDRDIKRATKDLENKPWYNGFKARKRRMSDASRSMEQLISYIPRYVTEVQRLTRSENFGPRSPPVASSTSEDKLRDPDEPSRIIEWSSKLPHVKDLTKACLMLNQYLPEPDWAGFRAKSAVTDRTADGRVYSRDKIKNAEATAQSFYDVWSKTPQAGSQSACPFLPGVDFIKNIAQICLVLKLMEGGGNLLKKFCQYHDKFPFEVMSLPLRPFIVKEILSDQPPAASQLFLAEQYRVKRRDYLEEWEDGQKQPVDLALGEPAPFTRDGGTQGFFARVEIWRHVDDEEGQIFAVKSAREPQYNAQIYLEQDALKKIKPHEHVIQLVSVLKRDGNPMLMLKPAAASDLAELLRQFSQIESPIGTKFANIPEPDHLRKVLRTAFGCLSHGLCHLHREVRHRDIKLDNILYVKENDGGARLLFTDFGIAHYYGPGHSDTTKHAWNYSRQCDAPEVLESSHEYMKNRGHRLEQSRKLCQRPASEETPSLGQHPSAGRNSHQHDSRADVFSLGACFMRILSVLVRSPLPHFTDIPEDDRYYFTEHVQAIQDWALEEEKRQGPSGLKPAFQVARGMFQFDKRDRWGLKRVILHLTTPESEHNMFCSLRCYREAKALAERSSTKEDHHYDHTHGTDLPFITEPDEEEARVVRRTEGPVGRISSASHSDDISRSSTSDPLDRDSHVSFVQHKTASEALRHAAFPGLQTDGSGVAPGTFLDSH